MAGAGKNWHTYSGFVRFPSLRSFLKGVSVSIRFIVACSFLALITSTAMSQTPADEAMAKLKAKQQQRDAERAASIQITRGELDDLKSRLRLLEAENAELKRKMAVAVAGKSRRAWTKIDIGMTRDELTIFLNVHQREYRMLSAKVDAGKTSTKEQTVIHRDSQRASETVRNGNSPQSKAVAEGALSNETIERSRLDGKSETMVLGILGKRTVVTGSHGDPLGGSHDDYGNEVYQRGTVTIVLTNDIVSSVEGSVD